MVIYIKLILSALLSGFVVIAGRLIINDMSAYSVMLIRFALASIIMFFMLMHKGELQQFAKLKPAQWGAFFALSFTGLIGYNFFMLLGLKTIPAARAGIIYGLYPLFIWLAAWVVFKERLGVKALAGSVVCLAGVFLALNTGTKDIITNLGFSFGDALLLLSLLCWASYTLITRYLLKTLSALFVSAVTCMLATIFMLVPTLIEGLPAVIGSIGLFDWGILLVLGFFSTVLAFVWYCQGIDALGAGKGSLFLNIAPLGTVFMAVIFLDEPLLWQQVVGAIFVFVGVWLASHQAIRE